MNWLFLIFGAVLVSAIAVVAVGSVVRRLDASARPVVLEVDDATDWIADRLPVEAAGQLSRDDVVSVIGWYLEVFDEAGLATDYGQELGDAALDKDQEHDEAVLSADRIVAPLDGALEHVVARGLEQSDPLDAVSVAVVADLLGVYLQALGAIGSEADIEGFDSRA